MFDRLNVVPAALVLAMTSSAALAGVEEEEHFDVHVSIADSKVQVGAVDADHAPPEFFPGIRVFEAELGEEGTPNAIDEPGFYSESYTAGASLGFNIIDALREWNGTDFNSVSSQTMTVWADFDLMVPPNATTPAAAGGFTPGFTLGTADGSGAFDLHPDFVLDSPANDGIYLLTLELVHQSSTAGTVANSDPVWFVFGQNADHEDVEIAAQWVEETLVPAPGASLSIAAFGAIGLMRRRR